MAGVGAQDLEAYEVEAAIRAYHANQLAGAAAAHIALAAAGDGRNGSAREVKDGVGDSAAAGAADDAMGSEEVASGSTLELDERHQGKQDDGAGKVAASS